MSVFCNLQFDVIYFMVNGRVDSDPLIGLCALYVSTMSTDCKDNQPDPPTYRRFQDKYFLSTLDCSARWINYHCESNFSESLAMWMACVHGIYHVKLVVVLFYFFVVFIEMTSTRQNFLIKRAHSRIQKRTKKR